MEGATPVDLLKRAIQVENVAAVVGAGVSKAAANLPDWKLAAERAIDHLQNVGTATPEQVTALRRQLASSTSTEELINCAAAVRAHLQGESESSGEFASWLKATFDVPFLSVSNQPLLRAIHVLKLNLVTTTNYDKLLELFGQGVEPVTWRDSHQLEVALRDGGRIVHLHGVWDDPDSVIFGQLDYDAIADDAAYRAFAQTLWLSRTILFIGCSFDGMRDPDFARLLDWAERTFPHSTARHFALVRIGSYSEEQAGQFLNRWRIQLVPYGERYEDLGPFLRSLAPPRPMTAPLPPAGFVGHNDVVASVKEAVRNSQTTLVHGMGGIGKTAAVAKALADLREEQPQDMQIWIDLATTRESDLVRLVGTYLDIPNVQALGDDELRAHVTYALANTNGLTTIFDNVTDLVRFRAFLQACVTPGASLIAISRNRSVGFDQQFEVMGLSPADADTLFSDAAGVPLEHPLVHEITSLLEGHPLAILLAAGRYAAEGLPLDRLRDRLSQEKYRLSTLRDPEQEETASTSVRASLRVSLDGLSSEHAETLAMAAHFLADTSIDLLATAIEVEAVECEDRVGRLVSRSLAQGNDAGLVHLHQLIRDVVRERFDSVFWYARVEKTIGSLVDTTGQNPKRHRRKILNDIENVILFVLRTDLNDSKFRKYSAIGLGGLLTEAHGIFHMYGISVRYSYYARNLTEKMIAIAMNVEEIALVVESLCCHAAMTRSLESLERALSLAIDNETDKRKISAIKCDMGNITFENNDYVNSEIFMRSGLADALESGSEVAIAQLKGQLGRVLLYSGNISESKALYTEARNMYGALGEPIGVAACAAHLAEIEHRCGNEQRSWEFRVESFEEDLKGENFNGALGSLELLSSDACSPSRLSFVLNQIDAIEVLLPRATLEAHPGLADSLRGRAYVGFGDLVTGKAFVEASLEKRLRGGDIQGAAVSSGDLSNIALSQHDYESAWTLNLQSGNFYEEAGNLSGRVTCYHNGVSIAVGRNRIEDAVDQACSAIALSASVKDLVGAVKTFQVLLADVVPRLQEPTKVQMPGEDLNFDQLMSVLLDAAEEKNIGDITGAMLVLTQKFGPGGTTSPLMSMDPVNS